MSETILTLDQSLNSTGFVLLRDDGPILSGSWPLCDGPENRALGFRELWGNLDAMNKGHGLDLIIHERPVFGAANHGEDQLIGTISMVGVIELFAISRGIRTMSYAVQTWRTTFFTKAERKAMNAKPKNLRDWKHAAILRARQLGFDPVTHDEAEAIGITDHHLLKNKITPEWRKEAGKMLDMIA